MRSFLLKDYKKVIVDGSIFINRFPEALAQELSGTKYYIASSFGAECACYQMHMTKEQRQVFDDNAAVLKKENAIFLEHSENLWSGLVHASTRGERVLLITSNLLLIEKIVLRELELDICDLHKQVFMPHSEFGTYRAQYTCRRDREVDSPVRLFEASEGTLDVYDENRLYLTLKRIAGGGKKQDGDDDEIIEEGLEAYLYEVPVDPGHMAKLFKHKRRSQDKLDHVKALLELNRTSLHCDWAALPEQMLYLGRSGNPLGFMMRRFRKRRTLDVAMSDKEFTLEKKLATVLDWCIMLTTELAYLAVFGLYVTDFSGCNFLVPDDDDEDRRINLLDIDSYCRDTYYGGKIDGEISHWRILDASHSGSKADLIDMSIRLLFAEIFRIITGNNLPYQGLDRYLHDPEVGLMPEDSQMRYLFPGKILKLMDRVLSKKSLTDPHRAMRLPSLDGLVAVLLQTREDMKVYSPEVTYGTLLQWHGEGVSWPINGLGAPQESPEADPWEGTTREPEKPKTRERDRESRRKQKQSSAPRPQPRAVRRPDRNDPFTSARLMGAVMEPETMPLPNKPPRNPISRKRVNDWRHDVQQDREKAPTVNKWFSRGLFLTLFLLAVWLCLFADFSLLHQIRHSVLGWIERSAEWWTDEVLPLMDRTWEHIRSILPWLRENR